MRADEAEAKGGAAEAEARAVKRARGAMLLVVTVQVLGMLYLLLTGELDVTMGAVMLAFTSVYVGLWAWARRSPLPASVVGLVVFVVVHAIEALIDPAALVRGAVIIAVIVAVLSWAVAGGLAHRKLVRAG